MSTTIIEKIRERLKEELPGRQAHIKMAPLHNGNFFRGFDPPKIVRKSAVLVPLFINDSGQPEILFTLRSSKVESHKGQISFPGGMSENGESIIETALREANEEVGIKPSDLEVLGQLSDLYVPPSNSVISPIVAFIDKKVQFVLSHDEVEEVFIVPVQSFFEPEKMKKEIWNFKGTDVEVLSWAVHHSTPLWGATAMILMEFLQIYQEANQK